MTQLEILLNPSVARHDEERLSIKQLAVLARLQRGPATNRELNDICFSYRQRLSELRDAGFVIDCERKPGGLAIYTMKKGV